MRLANRAALVLLLVSLPPLAACGAPPAPRLDVALREATRAPRPTPLRLAVAPLVVGPDATLRPVDPEERWSPVPVDIPGLRAALATAAESSGAFAEVAFLADLADRERWTGDEGAPGAAPAGPPAAGRTPAFRVPPPPPPAEAVEAAFAGRFDLVLTLEVRRHAVHFVDRNNYRWVPNLFNFVFNVWPAWLVADERYRAELEVLARVRAAGSEAVVFEKTYTAAPVKELDHFQRGWKLLGIFTVPGSLTQENYARAGDVLLPYARNEVAVALAADLAALAGEASGAAFGARLAHGLAVCVGAGRYRAIDDLRVASDDAQAVAQALRERAGLAARNVVLLEDAEATRERVLEAVRERAARGGPRDTLYFYFSGYGFESGGKLHLAAHDLERDRPAETAIALDDLAEALGAGRARQVVVLDASFGGVPGRGAAVRTLGREQLAGAGAAATIGAGGEAAVRAGLERFGRGRAVIVAAGPGGVALERSPIREQKKGLLTVELVEALGSTAADQDGDGWLTLAEIFARARERTESLSARGTLQVPELYADGVDPKGLRIARSAKR